MRKKVGQVHIVTDKSVPLVEHHYLINSIGQMSCATMPLTESFNGNVLALNLSK